MSRPDLDALAQTADEYVGWPSFNPASADPAQRTRDVGVAVWIADCGAAFDHDPHLYRTPRGKAKACDGSITKDRRDTTGEGEFEALAATEREAEVHWSNVTYCHERIQGLSESEHRVVSDAVHAIEEGAAGDLDCACEPVYAAVERILADRRAGEGDREALARDLIVAERRRQIAVEGWTVEHDREHGASELVKAAWAYRAGDVQHWPWDRAWWKPKDAFSNLVRAGALYLAALAVPGQDGTASGPRAVQAQFDITVHDLTALIEAVSVAAGYRRTETRT